MERQTHTLYIETVLSGHTVRAYRKRSVVRIALLLRFTLLLDALLPRLLDFAVCPLLFAGLLDYIFSFARDLSHAFVASFGAVASQITMTLEGGPDLFDGARGRWARAARAFVEYVEVGHG